MIFSQIKFKEKISIINFHTDPKDQRYCLYIKMRLCDFTRVWVDLYLNRKKNKGS